MSRRFGKTQVAAGASLAVGAMVGPVSAQSYATGPDNTAMMLTIYLVIAAIAFLFYLIPTFVAFSRKHPNRWLIAVINVAFGGTVIGWFGALVWAMSAAHLSPTGSNGGESGLNIFANDPVTVRVARDIEPFVSSASTPFVQPTSGPQPSSRSTGGPPKPGIDTIGQLERLTALRASGSLNDEEFAAMKASVLRST